jgi:hypothetical protein
MKIGSFLKGLAALKLSQIKEFVDWNEIHAEQI